MKRFMVIFLVLCGLLSMVEQVIGCSCERPNVCAAYSRARKVFVGKLESASEIKPGFHGVAKVIFSVERTFKGKTESNETVSFEVGECNELEFIVGEKYLVYIDDGDFNRYCNRTSYLKASQEDLEYASNVVKGVPHFLIAGYLSMGADNFTTIRRKTDISVIFDGVTNRIAVDKDGRFSYEALEPGNYQVRIEIPAPADVTMRNDLITFENAVRPTPNRSRTLVTYDLTFKPNECDFRKISFGPKVRE